MQKKYRRVKRNKWQGGMDKRCSCDQQGQDELTSLSQHLCLPRTDMTEEFKIDPEEKEGEEGGGKGRGTVDQQGKKRKS